MSKDPAFLFYYNDFLVGVDHMTDEQVGQYIKCLCHQANRGSIRNEHMINICKSSVNHKIITEKFKTDPDGGLFNERLRLELDKRKSFCNSRRDNRKIGHMNNICETHVLHMGNRDGIENATKPTKRTAKAYIPTIDTKGFSKPTLEQVRDYCVERKNTLNPQAFVDFYDSKGWKVGNQAMKDWKAAVRTWETRHKAGPVSPAAPKVLNYESDAGMKNLMADVKIRRKMDMPDERIKRDLLGQGIPEAAIDKAMGKEF